MTIERETSLRVSLGEAEIENAILKGALARIIRIADGDGLDKSASDEPIDQAARIAREALQIDN